MKEDATAAAAAPNDAVQQPVDDEDKEEMRRKIEVRKAVRSMIILGHSIMIHEEDETELHGVVSIDDMSDDKFLNSYHPT